MFLLNGGKNLLLFPFSASARTPATEDVSNQEEVVALTRIFDPLELCVSQGEPFNAWQLSDICLELIAGVVADVWVDATCYIVLFVK